MKRALAIAITMVSLTMFAVCDVDSSYLPSNDDEVCQGSLDSFLTYDLERRGCCSWHGGVCGCHLGRALCCDGTLSPSCGC